MEEFSMSENAKDLIQQEIDRNPFLVLSKLVYQQIYREILTEIYCHSIVSWNQKLQKN